MRARCESSELSSASSVKKAAGLMDSASDDRVGEVVSWSPVTKFAVRVLVRVGEREVVEAPGLV